MNKTYYFNSTIFLTRGLIDKQVKVFYSTLSKNNVSFYNSVFESIYHYINNDNEDSLVNKQKNLELFLINQFYDWKENHPNKNTLSINFEKYPKILKEMLYDFHDAFHIYYNNLKIILNQKTLMNKHDSNSDYNVSSVYNNLDKDIVFSLLLQAYLEIITNIEGDIDYKYSSVARFNIKLGNYLARAFYKSLYNSYCKDQLDVNNIMTFPQWKKLVFRFNFNDEQLSYIGSPLIDILVSANLIEMETKTINYKHKVGILKIPKRIAKHIKDFKLKVLPLKLPMICKPNEYKIGEDKGGYLLNGQEFYNDIIINKKGYKIQSVINEDNIIYTNIKILNSCPYKVNKEVLNFIIENNDKFQFLTNKDLLISFEDKEKLSNTEINLYKSIYSKIQLENNILLIADLYKHIDKIYFPVRIDQRDRIYCEPSYFNYQGNELAKSLILFSDPGYISRDDHNGINFLKIYGANCFGLDKYSFSYRINWVDKNKEDIINYRNGILLNKTKNKTMFLAFCMEYARWEKYFHSSDSKDFKTYLPIQLDCTCNGFQHLALLSTETKLWDILNLNASTIHEPPKDFYAYILLELDSFIDSKLLEKDKDSESYKRLKSFIFNRNHIKKVIMTIPYNARPITMIETLRDKLTLVPKDLIPNNFDKNIRWYCNDINEDFNNILNDNDIRLVIECVRKIISKQFPKIRKLGDYLKNISSLCSILNIPIIWNHNKGLKIYQSYLKSTTIRIQPFKTSNIKISLAKTFKDKFDPFKQHLALMPNVIHSLDAVSLLKLITEFNKLHNTNNFYAIHDCFAVTADNVNDLISILKSVYISIYIEDQYIKVFDRGIIDNIKYQYGDDAQYDEEKREIFVQGMKKPYKLYPLEWVLGKEELTREQETKIKQSMYLVN